MILLLVAIAADAVAAQPVRSEPCEEAVRSHVTLQGLLTLVGQLKQADPLWSTYRPAAARYVFVIPAPDAGRCAAIWVDGALRSIFSLATPPRLDTPLYGFYRPTTAELQPAQLRERLEAAAVREAVILSLDGDARLKLSMSSRAWFIDMAIHEAVHLLVQFPARSGGDNPPFRWPAWTVPQPDRAALAARCYGSVNPKEQVLSPERTALHSAAMTALAGGPLAAVCRDTQAFVAERRRRWSSLAAAVPSEDGGGSHSCVDGEAIMELNEGVPAFVAWLTARQLGVIDDERLRLQFNVQQRDAFYMTGTMQLTVLRRLLGDRFIEFTERLASAPSPSAASIFSTLEAELSRSCR